MQPLNELGMPIDLRGLQAILILLPVVLVVGALAYAGWKRRQRMKDAGM